MRNVWVVRGGEDNRLVDEFVDNGVVGVGYFTVPGDPDLTAEEVCGFLEAEGTSGIPAHHATMFVEFARAMREGDIVIMPDTPRRDVVIGEVTGAYRYEETIPFERYRHRRPVRWLGRASLDEVPERHSNLYRQRVTFANKGPDHPLLAFADAVAAGQLGRPAGERPAGSRRVRPARRAAGTAPSVRSERVCPGCGLLRSPSLFPAGSELCADCGD
jgi:hypothetical protein